MSVPPIKKVVMHCADLLQHLPEMDTVMRRKTARNLAVALMRHLRLGFVDDTSPESFACAQRNYRLVMHIDPNAMPRPGYRPTAGHSAGIPTMRHVRRPYTKK